MVGKTQKPLKTLANVRDMHDFCLVWHELKSLTEFDCFENLSPAHKRKLLQHLRELADAQCISESIDGLFK